MELNNLGEVLRFAIKLEGSSEEFYEKKLKSETRSKLRNFFSDLSKENKKRKLRIENLYKENVYSDQDTGIFEPIAELNSDDYLNFKRNEISISDIDYLTLAAEIEKNAYKFCHDISNIMNSRRKDISIIFEKMAKQNLERKEKIESLQE